MKKDSINSLHEAFTGATQELLRAGHRLEQARGRLRAAEERQEAEEKSRAEVSEVLGEMRAVLQSKLEALHVATCQYQSKRLHLERVEKKLEILPTIISDRTDELVDEQNKIVTVLQEHPLLHASSSSDRPISSQITQAWRKLESMRQEKDDSIERTKQKLNASIDDDKQTVALLRACIDGMLRQNQQLHKEKQKRTSSKPKETEPHLHDIPGPNTEHCRSNPIVTDQPWYRANKRKRQKTILTTTETFRSGSELLAVESEQEYEVELNSLQMEQNENCGYTSYLG